jgi:hypothetical protein
LKPDLTLARIPGIRHEARGVIDGSSNSFTVSVIAAWFAAYKS